MFHITYLALVHWKVSKKALLIMVVMKALAQCQETLTQLFLQDFDKKHGFSEIDKSNNNFKSKKPILFFLYSLDFWLCHLIIGENKQAKDK